MGIFFESILLLIFLAFFVFFVIQVFNMFFRGFAPFISTRPKVVQKIIDELPLSNTKVLYELGCGRAGFLRAVRKSFPNIKLIGFEYSFLPYLIGQIQNSFAKSHLIIKKKNIFQVDLSEAEVIYCYLNIATMKKLEDKFKKNCKPGTVIASYQFPLPNTEPEKVIKVRDDKDRVYIYKM